MRPHWVALGLSVGVPSAVLSLYLRNATWTETLGHTTYTHQFTPITWMAFAGISVISFLVMGLGLVLGDGRKHAGSARPVCRQCGAPQVSRYCQNCGARFE